MCSGLFSVLPLMDLGRPLITIERALDSGTSAILCDNYGGGVLAAQHLIDKGCRCLLHLGGVVGNSMPADLRAKGFIDTCEKCGVQHIEASFSEELYERMEYLEFLQEMFAMHPDIDGAFTSSDLIAAQVLQLCAGFNIKVPEQLKIVGFDDIPLAGWTVPTLTTVKQPIPEMAEMAVRTLIDAQDGKAVPVSFTFPVVYRLR